MRARQLITVSGVAYGPETLRVIIKAFDGACADLARSTRPCSSEDYEWKLANIILAEASEHHCDATALKNTALSRLQTQHLEP